MISLLAHRVWPTPGAFKAAPLTADEIDQHPDADRIWATIMKMREEASQHHDLSSFKAVGL